MNAGATFITRMAGSGDGIRLAVKDLIDVAGVLTTAGSRALAATAAAAERDAPYLAGALAASARVVGKASLSELAYGASGVNEYFGTPVNPLDPGVAAGAEHGPHRPDGARCGGRGGGPGPARRWTPPSRRASRRCGRAA